MIVRRLWSWFRDAFRRGTLETELDEELQFHLDREIEVHIESGLTPEEAERRARASFGGLDAIREECREVRGAHALETLFQDLRYAARGMRRNPGFTLTAVLTLALTLAAVSTVLTLANTLFLRLLPVADPERVVEVRATRRGGSEDGFVSYPDYLQFRDGARTLQGLAAVYPAAPVFITTGDEAREVNGAVVSANFFGLLGVEPALGRFFRPEEDRVPDRDRVIVLGHELWRTWFGGTPDVLGRSVDINGTTFTVVGVAPSTFSGIAVQPAQIYMPTMMLPVGYRWCSVLYDEDCTILQMIGRLKEGFRVADAGTEMATLMPERWARAAPGDNSGVSVVVARAAQPGPAETGFLRLLSWVAAALLLVCCANLAGLLLARSSSRTHELAIRTSLGAPRGRLVRQLLSESVLLALVGGAAGVGLSVALTRTLDSMFFTADGTGRPLSFDFGLDPAVVLAVVALSLGAGLVFGVLPALKAVRMGSAVALDRHSRAVTARAGASRWLLGAQAAAAVALTVVAALLANSALFLLTEANVDPSRVALLRLRPRLVGYSPERAQRYLHSVVDRLDALPGVRAVSMFGTGGQSANVSLAGPSSVDAADFQHGVTSADYLEIGPRYFETQGTPILRGREFERLDTVDSAPVAIVGEALARSLWPDGDPLGATLLVDDRQRTVIGLVADVQLQTRAEPPRPHVYVPFWQNPDQIDARLLVLVETDPAAMLPTLAHEASRVDPDVPVSETVTLTAMLAGSFRPLRMSATAVSYAAALAVVLSAVGLYASLAWAVARRTREIGLRQALGCSASDIMVLVAREGMSVVAAGIVAGVGLALAGARLLEHLLYGSATGDAPLYGAACLLVASIGLIACWLPAHRAAAIQPTAALRSE